MTQPLWLSFTIQHIHRKTGSLNMENTFGFYSSSVHGCPLSYSSTLSIPLTPKPNSPQTPANAACKATDLFWFCRIRRQQKGEDSDREAKKLRDGARERGIHSATAPFSHCTDASHLFSSELMHSYQGQNDVVNKRQGGGGGGWWGGSEEYKNRLCIHAKVSVKKGLKTTEKLKVEKSKVPDLRKDDSADGL